MELEEEYQKIIKEYNDNKPKTKIIDVEKFIGKLIAS